MATTAQIDANRRNSLRSSGPKTDSGKRRSRENALKHGLRAYTIMPVLPHEDPERVDERTREWMDSVQPRNALERDLTAQGASLTLDIERAHRLAVGHMARRVVIAARLLTRRVPKRLRKQIEELGRRLLYIAGPEDIKVDKQPPGDDSPGLLVAELEDTAEGCRWLLERWAEYRNLLDGRTEWEEPILVRFIRLQGKRLVEAVYDPVLNSIFLAWDVLMPNYARVEWESYREERSILDPALTHRLQWRRSLPGPRTCPRPGRCCTRSSMSTSAGSRSCWPRTRPSRRSRTRPGGIARRWIAAQRSSGTGATSRPRRGSCTRRWTRS